MFITLVELYRFRRKRLHDLWHAGEIAAFAKEKKAKYDTDYDN